MQRPTKKIKVSPRVTSRGDAIIGLTFEANATIDEVAFLRCQSLEKVTFKGDAIIGERAFSTCVGLKKVTFERNATIKQSGFSGCQSLTEVTFGGDANSIQGWAFLGCGKLKKVTFEGDTSIQTHAFMMCTGLEEVTFERTASIQELAFLKCSCLKTVTFKGNATITERAFSICEELKEVTFTKGVTTQGVTTEGVTTEGVTTEGVTTQGVTTEGWTTEDVRTTNDHALWGLHAIEKSSWAKADAAAGGAARGGGGAASAAAARGAARGGGGAASVAAAGGDDATLCFSHKQYEMGEIRKYHKNESGVTLTTSDDVEHLFTFANDTYNLNRVVIKWESKGNFFYNVNLINNSLCEKSVRIRKGTLLYRFARPSRMFIDNGTTFFSPNELRPHFLHSYLNSFKDKYTLTYENTFNMYKMKTTEIFDVLYVNDVSRRDVMGARTDVATFENTLMAWCLARKYAGWIAISGTDNEHVLPGGRFPWSLERHHALQFECALSNARRFMKVIKTEKFETIRKRWCKEKIIVFGPTGWSPCLIDLRL